MTGPHLLAPSAIAVCRWCGMAGATSPPGDAETVLCTTCGVRSTWPYPEPDELDLAYNGWYRPAGGRFLAGGDRILRSTRRIAARRLLKRVPEGPVLDIGAGDGTLVRFMREQGREAFGIEREATPAGWVDDADLKDLATAAWAGVIFWHSLEHLDEPVDALRETARILRPGGLIMVAMPNAGSWQARVFGPAWFGRDLPRHLTHVPARTLLHTLDDVGLVVERVSHLRAGQAVFGWLHGLVGLLPGSPHLYDAIRRPGAQERQQSRGRQALAIAAALLLLPLAVLVASAEAAARSGGMVYVEARKRQH